MKAIIKEHIVLDREYMKSLGYSCSTNINFPYSMYINKNDKLVVIYYECYGNAGTIQIKRYIENKTLFGGKLYSKNMFINTIKSLAVNE